MGRTVQLCTTDAADTRRLAATVAGALRAGDVVSLTGELGAGKTCFVQGAAAALGVVERVTSPSFVLRRDYQGTIDVLHLDVYRLDRLQEVLDLGYAEDAEYPQQSRRRIGRVTFVEWGDAVRPLLPSAHLEVELRLPQPDAGSSNGSVDEEIRYLTVRPHGAEWLRRIVGLAADLQPWRPAERGLGS